ncbi:hypothetical protein P168DRAFT_288719 [Aspergillus campestris IBT 28561]|uniref:Phosphatidyl synthase n=1 Tax=Aspergillus campestris (strain IBT 28561) TaxID=1392248 RepID=A0A2I1DAC1_ASPC2|nr:uncharacterized protein P168DRAFT_288719 [Aspergillus campestris IBT 28561]PKY06824.1 hypothetical protein P168DRAFT_288719 [Aspergillus campestris IBT 28561]
MASRLSTVSLRTSGHRVPLLSGVPSLGYNAVSWNLRRGLQAQAFRGATITTSAIGLSQNSLRSRGSFVGANHPRYAGYASQQKRWTASGKPDKHDTQSDSKKPSILSKIPLPTTRENIYTVPNILTFSRLVAAPLVGYFLVYGHHTAALALFAYAGITDLVDGYIARRYNLQTVVGTIIDPMADKLLMTIGVACLAVNGSIPVWLAVIILGRDTMARYWDFSLPSAEVKPTAVSKANTALQLLLVGSAIAMPVVPEPFLDAWNLKEAMSMFQYLVAGTTIWSGLSYVFSNNAVKILSKEEIQRRIAKAAAKK